MKLRVIDIPAEGLDLTVHAGESPWFDQILVEAFQEDWRQEAASLDLHLFKTCENVSLSGRAEVGLRPSCDRCLSSFTYPLNIPIDMTLAPRPEKESPSGESDVEDVNFGFYQGGVIDLAKIVHEFLLLAIPLRYLCGEGCKGICPQCGTNLNERRCDCRIDRVDPRLEVLKNFRQTR